MDLPNIIPFHRFTYSKWNHYFIHTYIYIYIYVCVCVIYIHKVSRKKNIRLAEITDESIGKRLYHEIQALLQNQYPAKGQRGNMLAKRTERKRRDESRVQNEVLASTPPFRASEFSRVKFETRILSS